MRARVAFAVLSTLAIVVACNADTLDPPLVSAETGVRVINGFDAPVDIVIDGVVRQAGLASGALTVVTTSAGDRNVAVRRAGGAIVALPVRVSAGRATSVAALRVGTGTLSLESLDDTNAIVPAGASKLRVLHLAANAGEVQVWRTQPDYQTPIRWAFPFNYNSVKVYFQSTPGDWEVRVWTDTSTARPGDVRGWAMAIDTARVTLGSGAKKTVVILDAGNGRVKLEVID